MLNFVRLRKSGYQPVVIGGIDECLLLWVDSALRADRYIGDS